MNGTPGYKFSQDFSTGSSLVSPLWRSATMNLLNIIVNWNNKLGILKEISGLVPPLLRHTAQICQSKVLSDVSSSVDHSVSIQDQRPWRGMVMRLMASAIVGVPMSISWESIFCCTSCSSRIPDAAPV